MGIADYAAEKLGLRNKPKPQAPSTEKQLPRVKTPAEYELEDAATRETATAVLRRAPQVGQKLVPDSVLYYGEK